MGLTVPSLFLQTSQNRLYTLVSIFLRDGHDRTDLRV